MHTSKIPDEGAKRIARIFSTDKVEKVNPVDYFKNYEIEKRAIVLRDMLFLENPVLTLSLSREFFIKEAKETLEGFFEVFEQTKIHPNLDQLLTTTRKKDQINLLKGISLNTDELTSLIFKSYTDHGYLFSRYIFENLPKGLEGKKLPKIFEIKDDGAVEKIGATDLTDGQLKNVILHRKVIVSNFFEKDDVWHCFFITYESASGREKWKDGQPHFHYISSAFGITKEDFIESMRSGNYLSTPVHIDLLGYGQQPT